MSKIILDRPIEPDQVVKLLENGRTDLLKKFISKKGRPFSAYLVRAADGKIGFEFEQKKTKKDAEVGEGAEVAAGTRQIKAKPAGKKTATTK
jgi:DNA topoisomerase-3